MRPLEPAASLGMAGTSGPICRISALCNVLGVSHPQLPELLANQAFAVPMTGLHVRRMFDERCRVR